ncbi:MAG: immunity 51 family protein [Ruminococcus sp.]|nr:immunity 51 family protein [Ruminococcus sp.]
MSEYLSVYSDNESISITFYIDNENILKIGAEIEKINPDAYMNGYNWEAFLNYYLEKQSPDVLINMDSDPEADMYTVYYENTEKNSGKVKKLAAIIEYLIENPDDIYEIVREHGGEIEWD